MAKAPVGASAATATVETAAKAKTEFRVNIRSLLRREIRRISMCVRALVRKRYCGVQAALK
jgi:hypothetical protein